MLGCSKHIIWNKCSLLISWYKLNFEDDVKQGKINEMAEVIQRGGGRVSKTQICKTVVSSPFDIPILGPPFHK